VIKYQKMLRYVLANGVEKPTRAVLESTGKNIDAISVFGYQETFDISETFPLLTTKRTSFHNIAHELIWMLRGESNIRYLQENNVKIWDQWSTKTGDLGPVYGVQWRAWSSYNPNKDEIVFTDQIKNIINGITGVKNNPTASIGRRLILNSWNVGEIEQMALPPCHLLAQFMVTNGKLSCQLYQRSADLFLGVPYNIASYALLTCIIAKITGLKPDRFIHTFGDLHIYSNHVQQVEEQLERKPNPLPILEISDQLSDIDSLRFDNLKITNYLPHPPIKAEIAV